jgi:hypothetical protein
VIGAAFSMVNAPKGMVSTKKLKLSPAPTDPSRWLSGRMSVGVQSDPTES